LPAAGYYQNNNNMCVSDTLTRPPASVDTVSGLFTYCEANIALLLSFVKFP